MEIWKPGFGVLALLVAVSASALATDVSGNWKYVVKNPQGTFQQSIVLKQEGTKISGHILSPRGRREEIQEGKVSGDEIEFSVARRNPGGDKPTTVPYKGKVVGDEMKGYFLGPGGHRQEWTAKRVILPTNRSKPLK